MSASRLLSGKGGSTLLLLALRRMSSSKWMIACLLIGSIMAAAFVGCIPIYMEGILQRMLTKDLENYQIESGKFPGQYRLSANFQYVFDYKDRAKAYKYFNDKILGGMVDNYRLPVITGSQEVSLGGMGFENYDMKGKKQNVYADLGALSQLADHVKITNGRMFSTQSSGGVYEVVATDKFLHDNNVLLDKEYELKCFLSDHKDISYKIKVVGIITVKDTSDPYWAKNISQYSKMFLMDFDLFNNEVVGEDVGLIYTAQWAYAFDYHKMTLANMSAILDEYGRQAEWVKKYRSSLQLEMPAIPILDAHLERAQKLKTILWVLAVPVLIMLLFYIFMVSQLIIMNDENGIAVLKSRGAGKLQIFASYLIESLIIGAVALAAGPFLGMLLCRVLGASNGFLEFVQRTALPLKLNSPAFLYSLAAVLVFVITMLIPVVNASKTTIVNYKQSKARNAKVPIWKKFFLDILILASSAYGFYRYGQQQKILAATGIKASELQIDPLLFLTSTFFILGVGLVFLRIYPYLIRLVYWIGKRIWPPVMYASLIQVGRSGGREQFLMLFIILAVSSGIFSASSARTINRNIEDKINYQISADAIIEAVWHDNQPKDQEGPMGGMQGPGAASAPKEKLKYFEPDYRAFSTLSGTEQATKVLIANDATAQQYDQTARNIKFMGIIPNEFAKVAWFRADLLPYHWYQYLNLMIDAPKAFLLSSNLKDKLKVKLGDTIYVSWGEQSYIEGMVYAFVDYWPSYNPNPPEKGAEAPGLIVANYNYIKDKLAVQPYQVWVKKKEGATDKQINDDIEKKKLEIRNVTYKTQALIKQKNDPLLQGMNGSLTLSFIAAMIISTLGFLIYWIISIQSRVLYFGILRAMGLSLSKVIGMIACEQVLVSGVAIIIGFIIGGVASDLFIPMLQIVYSSAEQVPPFKIVADAGDYIKIYMVVAVMLVVGFITLWRIIAKIRIDQAVKLGED